MSRYDNQKTGHIVQAFAMVYRVGRFEDRYHVWLRPVREEPAGSKHYVPDGEEKRYSRDWLAANGVRIKDATYSPA